MSVFWITGASSGIGEALSIYLNSIGHEVIMSARSTDKLKKLQSKLQYPAKAKIVSLDLANYESLTKALPQALEAFGHIDAMVHNGGISQRSKAAETSFDVDDNLIKVNYLGTVYLTKLLLPHFLERKKGHFIVVSSLVGKFGTPYRSSYSASKHALHGFFDSLRAELHNENIKVLIACPGFIRTNISINALTGTGQPLGEMDNAQEKGMLPAEFAHRLYRAFEKNKLEVYIGGNECLGVYLKRFFPNFFAKMLLKAKVR